MLALNSCVFIDLVQLNKDRTILIVQSLLLAEISFVKLVESNRHFLLLVNSQLEQHFLSTLAIHSNPGVHIILLIKTNNCELKMREDIFFFDLDLSPSLLLILLKLE